MNLGHPSIRWAQVCAVAGTINTSSAAVKEGITPLDPSRAMQAVRATEAVTFDYLAPTRGPEWYDLPDDPEQAEAVLQQRLTAAPLEAAAQAPGRLHQRGRGPALPGGGGPDQPRPHRWDLVSCSAAARPESAGTGRNRVAWPTPIIQVGVPIDLPSLNAKYGAGAKGIRDSYVKLSELADWSAAYTDADLSAPVAEGGLGMDPAAALSFKSAMNSEVPQLKALIDALQFLPQGWGV